MDQVLANVHTPGDFAGRMTPAMKVIDARR